MKIAFMGAGSTVFVRNIMNDCMQILPENFEAALYDIDAQRLKESLELLTALNRATGKRAEINAYCGVARRKDALSGARYVINAIQVGGYKPSTAIDFKIPKRYRLRQTIGDTMGVGGIFRALRTIPVMQDFADDIHEVCPDALFLNYTNPMAMLTGYMQRYAHPNTLGLCHSVQTCAENLLEGVGMGEYKRDCDTLIAGINHMAWLLKITDARGADLYPEIKRRSMSEEYKKLHKNDLVRHKIMREFGYYVTESSEHNAEYNPFFIKPEYPGLIREYRIPLDEYPRRCRSQIREWKSANALKGAVTPRPPSKEYASRIINAVETDTPFKLGASVINNGIIPNLPKEACVEVPMEIDAKGIRPEYVGVLPLQLAAMNSSNIYPQMLAIEAARTRKKELIYQACFADPHTAAVLSLDDIKSLCDELIEAHGNYLPKYH
ncbi:MAG: alpha-glucosidase/alpha-galactosidase [Clostridiales bacterium]|jgi:alpha-galactosidase|nr:alpha-glucosidase/alpha-galactosidase [Clostridiales bacterium]